jgi:hypothetical protein
VKVESVIERVLQRYAGAARYADRGTALLAIGADEVTIDFQTSFERPDRFSFAYKFRSSLDDSTREVGHRIESDGPNLRMVGDLRLREPRSLSMAIAALTGVSMGCAHTIPRLLMPEVVGGRGLFDGPRRALGDRATIDGASHLAIDLGEGSGLKRVYVNEASLVVRRTEGPAPSKVTDYHATLTPPRA